MNSQVPNRLRHAGKNKPATTQRFHEALNRFVAGLVTGFIFSLLAMATIILLAIIAIPKVVPVFGDETRVSDVSSRPIGEMRRDVEAFMKNSKSKDDLDLQVGGIVDLCYMHQEIVTDPRFSSNRKLQSLRAVAADRLKKYLKTIEIEKARTSRRAKKEQVEANRKLLAGESVPTPTTKGAAEPTSNPLGSSGNVPHSDSQSASEVSDAEAMDELMYRSMNSIGELTGGPSQMFGYLSGNYAPPWDHGEELVNLIENTINPEFWKINGGSGIIYYYRPSRILVVGATSQIQDDLTNMLRTLRRLSR